MLRYKLHVPFLYLAPHSSVYSHMYNPHQHIPFQKNSPRRQNLAPAYLYAFSPICYSHKRSTQLPSFVID